MNLFKTYTATGAIFIATGIILGAFGAHAFKEILAPPFLASYEVGVRYQIYHGIAFLIIPFIIDKLDLKPQAIYYLILFGTLFFSLSIYILAFKHHFRLDSLKFLGPITPLGGTLLIIGWIVFLYEIIKSKIDA